MLTKSLNSLLIGVSGIRDGMVSAVALIYLTTVSLSLTMIVASTCGKFQTSTF